MTRTMSEYGSREDSGRAHHTEDAVSKCGGVVQGEAAGQQAGLEEQQDQVLHRLVALVSVSTLPQLLNRGHQR